MVQSPYWIKFTDGTTGCCEGVGKEAAEKKAEEVTGKTVESSKCLPYPATPLIWQDKSGPYGPCPPLCYTPRECAGKTSCPKNYACSE